MSGQLDLRGLGSHGKPDAAARQRGPLSAFAGSQAPTRPPLPPLRHTSLPRAGFCAREESPCRPDVGETLMRRAGPRPVPTKPTGPPKPQPAPPALTPQSQAPSVAVVGCSPKARRVDWLRPCTTPRPGATPCRCWSRWGSWRRARAARFGGVGGEGGEVGGGGGKLAQLCYVECTEGISLSRCPPRNALRMAQASRGVRGVK